MNDSWKILAKYAIRTFSILSIVSLGWLSAYVLLESFPWVAGFVTYLCAVVTVFLTSSFWSADLKRFRREIVVAHMVSLLAAWSICFSNGPFWPLWINGGADPDFTAASQRAALLGSLPGFLALFILLMVTWGCLYIKIKPRTKRPNS
jgi:hypothetical protein